jgi:hypothetical protein
MPVRNVDVLTIAKGERRTRSDVLDVNMMKALLPEQCPTSVSFLYI